MALSSKFRPEIAKDFSTRPITAEITTLRLPESEIGFPVDKRNLARILERERQRAQVEFPGSLFTPAEDIGLFAAARRYLSNLLDFIKKKILHERELQTYIQGVILNPVIQ